MVNTNAANPPSPVSMSDEDYVSWLNSIRVLCLNINTQLEHSVMKITGETKLRMLLKLHE